MRTSCPIIEGISYRLQINALEVHSTDIEHLKDFTDLPRTLLLWGLVQSILGPNHLCKFGSFSRTTISFYCPSPGHWVLHPYLKDSSWKGIRCPYLVITVPYFSRMLESSGHTT